MKTLILIIAFISASAHATTAQDFVGKYSVVSRDCSFLGQPTRAYIKIGKAIGGFQSLDIQMYGQDASALEILLDSGTRQVPGTSLSIHGAVPETWMTQIYAGALISKIHTERKSVNMKTDTVKTLSFHGNFLTYEEKVFDGINGKLTQSGRCLMMRQ